MDGQKPEAVLSSYKTLFSGTDSYIVSGMNNEAWESKLENFGSEDSDVYDLIDIMVHPVFAHFPENCITGTVCVTPPIGG